MSLPEIEYHHFRGLITKNYNRSIFGRTGRSHPELGFHEISHLNVILNFNCI